MAADHKHDHLRVRAAQFMVTAPVIKQAEVDHFLGSGWARLALGRNIGRRGEGRQKEEGDPARERPVHTSASLGCTKNVFNPGFSGETDTLTHSPQPNLPQIVASDVRRLTPRPLKQNRCARRGPSAPLAVFADDTPVTSDKLP